ncbi:MAG: tRNA (adenosine(37)-N6)-dimethylallyltransferase MiaA [Verrucomicrobia bacterium]|nr:MAG: tRNA (adenosine(37)-N6)-dimethylallyltransferase MiaA [Verrucomicrobiota bacterium]
MNDTFFIVGPTAVGKTSLAIGLAEQFDAEIINADAFQIYRGLDILTAKPDSEAGRQVRHHLLGQVSLAETMSAVRFGELAGAALADIRSRNKNAIIAGGSGLYLKAITHGFDAVPPPNPRLRQELSQTSLQRLQEKLISLDPETADRIDLKNRRRLVRAVEICLLTGKPASKQRTRQRLVETGSSHLEGGAPATPHAAGSRELAPPKNTTSNCVLLVRDRDDLYHRINERVNAMFREGVEEEVRALRDIGPTAANALGLKEICALIEGQISRAECIVKIQQATRRYAKRQLTWFRHQTTFPQLNLTPFSHREAVRVITRMFRRAEE